MAELYIDRNGLPHKYSSFEAADKVVKARKNGDVWEVIDLLLDLWVKTAGDEVEAIGINLDQYREQLVDKEFGSTKDGKDLDRRLMLSIPKKLIMMIRTQYSAQDLPFDHDFYVKFAQKYPYFRVAERI